MTSSETLDLELSLSFLFLGRGGVFQRSSLPYQENLGGFASHALRQELGGRQGRNRTDRTDRTDRTESSLSWHPVWELAPSAALIPFADVAPPVRVYVYGEADAGPVGKLTRSSAFCHYRQWGMDVGFHDFFRTSPVRTFDPDKADYFFVPTYACCHQVAGISDFDELDADHATLVSQLTYFQRSRGQDHIFSFHYIDLFPSWRSHIPRSVFLTPETEVGFERSLDDFGPDQGRIPPFNPLKDIVVPPFINMKDILGFETHAKPMREREHLATFAGKLWSDIVEAADVRGKVVALSSAPGFKIHAFSTIRDMLNPDGMQRRMSCLAQGLRKAQSSRTERTKPKASECQAHGEFRVLSGAARACSLVGSLLRGRAKQPQGAGSCPPRPVR